MTDAKKKGEHQHRNASYTLYRHRTAERVDERTPYNPMKTSISETDQFFSTLRRYFLFGRSIMAGFLWLTVLLLFILGIGLVTFEKRYKNNVYPNVIVDGIHFGGKSESEVRTYWEEYNKNFTDKVYEFRYEDAVATASGVELGLGVDANLLARQAYLVGRSGNIASDITTKFFKRANVLTSSFRWNENAIDDLLLPLSDRFAVPVAEALFNFQGGKVTEFRPSSDGQKVDSDETKIRFADILKTIPEKSDAVIVIPLVVKTIKPTITTDRANDFGIRELIGRGYSEYQGSIPGRLHNVALAASRFHGVLIKPGEVFSFNDTLGDVSAATGFQPAYVIKSGRTVLGDGGGVCQVSSTMFRAALAAGLPIVERTAHAYRVHYYEEGGYKAGLDATVFAPSVDLKFKNDTTGYILIQTKIDESVPSLTFEFYGTKDGRKSEILNHQVWGITPPPPPLYQDDPTLPVGVMKQVDFSAWGAKASFQYKVVAGDGTVLQDQAFYSNFRPWQAVFLKGTKQP